MIFNSADAMFGLLVLLFAAISHVVIADSLVTTDGCGQSKGCLHSPASCVSPDCEILATWKNSSTQGYMDFELMAKTPGWVALGLSYNSLMGDDSVMHCVVNSSNNNQVQVGYSYNYQMGANRYNAIPPVSELTASPMSTSASYQDGELHCRFSRPIISQGARVYPLSASYYLLLGFGTASNGAITIHNKSPFVSPQAVDVTVSKADVSSRVPQAPAPGSPGGNTVPPGASNPLPGGNPTWPSVAGGDMGANQFLDNDGKTKVSFSVSDDGSKVTFTLEREMGSLQSGWVAVGFSTDRDMGEDSVIDCIRKMDNTYVVQNSYNDNRGTNSLVIPKSNDTLTSVQTSFNNGVLRCVVQRAVKAGDPRIFDLDQSYYLLLASGPVDPSGTKEYHTSRVASGQSVDVRSSTGSVGTSGRCDVCLKRAHGILMITAWVLLVSTSIIIARYYRDAWPGKKLCTSDIWFSIHRMLMLLALACTIAGFIIIFVIKNGKISTYDSRMPSYFWVHAPLGIVVMILVIINPLLAACRCSPTSRFRPIFNWLHWLVGTSVHVVALITVFFGAKIGELNPPDRICHIAIFWILIAFVGFHVLIEIILSLEKCISDIRSKQSFQVQYEMSKPGEVPRVIESTGNTCSRGFRYFILVVYFLVVLGLWLAMVILIGSGNVGWNDL